MNVTDLPVLKQGQSAGVWHVPPCSTSARSFSAGLLVATLKQGVGAEGLGSFVVGATGGGLWSLPSER